MTRPSNWYPNKIYDLLYRLGHDNDEHLSYQEVGFMFLREALLPLALIVITLMLAGLKKTINRTVKTAIQD
jgi:hypothetical protein